MALEVMSFREACRLLYSLKNVKRHLGYFNQFKIELNTFDHYLDICIRDVDLYRKYIKNEC